MMIDRVIAWTDRNGHVLGTAFVIGFLLVAGVMAWVIA